MTFRNRLTTKHVEKLSRVKGNHSDGAGLSLRVLYPGAASWIFRYTMNKRVREAGLGRWPDVTLQRAREKMQAMRALKADGIDPLDHKAIQEAKERALVARGVPLGEVAEAYHAANLPGWRSSEHAITWLRSLQIHVPGLLAKPVGSINTDDVLDALRPVWHLVIAQRIRQRIESVLDYARVRGFRDDLPNPARWRGHLEHLLVSPVRKVEHHRALPFSEMPAVMAQLRSERTQAAHALCFLILTAARTREVLHATRREIDLETATWIIPPDRMKSHRLHRVPLSRQALEIAGHATLAREGQRANASNAGEAATSPLPLFHGQHFASPLSQSVLNATLKRLEIPSTVHGFRSTFRDWAGDEGYPRELCEAALAHTFGSDTERAYRRSDELARRRAMMQAYADALEPATISRTEVRELVLDYGQA